MMIQERTNENDKLNEHNKDLLQQLQKARESADAIKTGNIDALVITDKNELTIYTEKTADKIYRVLIEKMQEGAVTLNQNGIILYCNSSFANMVAQPLQKLIGTSFKIFIDAPLKQKIEDLFSQEPKEGFTEEAYLIASDGRGVAVMMSATAIVTDNVFVVSIILTDLTTQKQNRAELTSRTIQLEQKNTELEIANKDLTSFTYLSSHDLQEPLRKIQTFVSCLQAEDEKNLSPTGKHYFSRIQQTAKRMQNLIDDLLTYSHTRLDERKFEKTNLQSFISGIEKDLEDVISENNAVIEVSSLCEVCIIRFQFSQLVKNLIGNSLKFSRPGIPPHISISSELVTGLTLKNMKTPKKTTYCHIIYTDNGIGFDAKYNELIFDVFQRLNSQESYKGTGIGLAICKRVMENHKGFITATGHVNNGARFDIYFPAG